MEYHSDEIHLDIGNSLNGLLPMHCVYNQICPFIVQSHISDFQEPCVF